MVVRYVSLLRRMGELKYALSILSPIINNRVNKPTVTEVIEYSACLTRFGLEDESITRLSQIKGDSHAEVYYELASAYVSKWDYSNAARHFEKYLSFREISPYRIYVGKVNLAACYIGVNRIESAQVMLHKLNLELRSGGNNLLCGNVLELLGQIAIIERDFDSADKLFAESGKKLLESNPRYKLYLDKWVLISKMLREGGSKESIAAYRQFRQSVVKLMDWNTLREIELYKAVATDDEKKIYNLYYGVPYPEYRKRIQFVWRKPLTILPYFDLKIGQGSFDSKTIFDISSGKDLHSGRRLKPGQTMHRLLQVLASDQYSPFHTTRIFSNVYPDAFYNPVTSSQVVYKIIEKLNKWFKNNRISLFVHRGKYGYRLRTKKAYRLRISIREGFSTREDEFINDLLRLGLVENFSLQLVEDKLGLTKRTASRLLSESVKSGRLVRNGRAQNTVYSLVTRTTAGHEN